MATKKSTASREAAKQESRDALLAAGAKELAERGLDAPSLDDICARAGYTRGAFYVHFKDRDDFVVAVMERSIGGFLDALTEAGGSRPDLVGIISAFCAAVASGGSALGGKGEVRLAHLMQASARSPVVRARVALLIAEAQRRVALAAAGSQAAGTVRADLDPAALAAMLVAIALGIQVMGETKLPLDVTDAVAAMLGLLAPVKTDAPRAARRT